MTILLILFSFIVFIIVLLAIYVIRTYNQFISLGERVANGKAQIAAQIESRWDAITNLIAATKQYASYEAETLENIINKRVRVTENSELEQLENEEEKFNQMFSRLLAISENYPDLKASEVYKQTMASVEKFENNVRHARMMYNDIVTRFNRLVRMFPSNIIAMIFKFNVKSYFQQTETKEAMPSWD